MSPAPPPPPAPGGANPAIGPALLVAALGALLTTLAMFALDWLSEGSAALDRADLADLVDAFADFQSFNALTELYFSFGWVVVLVAAIAAIAVPFAASLRMPVVVVCLVGAAWSVFVLIDVIEEISVLDVGAYLVVAGPVVAAVGALMARPARV